MFFPLAMFICRFYNIQRQRRAWTVCLIDSFEPANEIWSLHYVGGVIRLISNALCYFYLVFVSLKCSDFIWRDQRSLFQWCKYHNIEFSIFTAMGESLFWIEFIHFLSHKSCLAHLVTIDQLSGHYNRLHSIDLLFITYQVLWKVPVAKTGWRYTVEPDLIATV